MTISQTMLLDHLTGARISFGPRSARDSRGQEYIQVRIEAKSVDDAILAMLGAIKAEVGLHNQVEIRTWPEVIYDEKTRTFAGYARLSRWTEKN